MKKVFTCLVIGVLAVVVLVSLSLGVVSLVFRHDLNSEIAKIKARGEPVTPEDLAPKGIPDSENAAVVFERIFKEMDKPSVARDLSRVSRFLVAKEREADPKLRSKTQQALDRTSYLLPALDEALARRKCRFRIDYGAMMTKTNPEWYHMRELSSLLLAKALLDARQGRMAEASLSIEKAFLVGERLKDEPAIVPQLVRIAVLSGSMSSLRDMLRRGDMSEGDAKRLFDLLGRIELGAGTKKALIGERAVITYLFTHATRMHHPLWHSDDADGKTSGEVYTDSFGPRLYLATIGPGDAAAYVRVTTKRIEEAGHTYPEVRRRGLLEGGPSDVPGYALVTRILTPVYVRAGTKRYFTEAGISATQIILALQAYKSRFRRYPDSLDDLRAGLGWKLPKDPFSGGDFIYRRQGKGFLLYSIGPDLKDDGGAEPSMPVRDVDETGDIVWKMGGEG